MLLYGTELAWDAPGPGLNSQHHIKKITTLELFNVRLPAVVSVGLVVNSDHAAEWNGYVCVHDELFI